MAEESGPKAGRAWGHILFHPSKDEGGIRRFTGRLSDPARRHPESPFPLNNYPPFRAQIMLFAVGNSSVFMLSFNCLKSSVRKVGMPKKKKAAAKLETASPQKDGAGNKHGNPFRRRRNYSPGSAVPHSGNRRLSRRAGGLLKPFFPGMPADTDPGMAFVLVQHLAPDHKSILSDLVKRYTRMPGFSR